MGTPTTSRNESHGEGSGHIRRGPRRGVVRGIAVVAVVASAAFAVACGTSAGPVSSASGSSTPGSRAESSPATLRTPDFAGLVDVGGRRIYLECSGTGSPTVVLLSGLDVGADLWNKASQAGPKVFPEVAKTTRVCAYDRPGTFSIEGPVARSDDAPQPTSPADAVHDLHAVLQAAHVPGPYVLAAHSYSGLVARVYAGTYPDDVAGIVFVDVLSPELRTGMTPKWWDAWKIANARPAEWISEWPAVERIDFDKALDQVVAAPPLRQMPVVVLSADQLYGQDIEVQASSGKTAPGVPAELGYVIDSANKHAQQQLADLVSGAKHESDTHSGHNMMVDQPRLVTDAIVAVVDAVRAGRTTATEADR